MVDNTTAIASVKKLSATPRVVTQNKRIFNRLWWFGTLLHLFWVKSQMTPADPHSKLSFQPDVHYSVDGRHCV